MADDGIKISALNEILTEPATGEMAAVVSGGVTYKRDIGKRLPSTTQKSALAGYGGAPSGTNYYIVQSAINAYGGVSGIDAVGNIRSPGWPAGGTRFFSGYSYDAEADVFNVYSDGRIEIGTYDFAPNGTISVREERTVLNWHAFEDYSQLTPAVDTHGYSSFDSMPHLFASANHLNSYQARPIVDGAADVTIMTCFGATVDHPGTGLINQIYSIRITEQTDDGPVLEQFGLFIGPLTKGTVNNYAIYSEGGDSYHNGSLGIGALPIDGWSLYVKQDDAGSVGNIQSVRDQAGTSSIGYGIASQFFITSADTATKVAFDGGMIANNALGTIASTRCFSATTYGQNADSEILDAKGYYSAVTGISGSVVDKYYGFFQDSLFSDVSVTEAYGFYSNIADGTTKFNFYSAGTAPNYFAGFTAFGSGSPYIKTKELSLTTASTEGGTASVAHGLDINKILLISVSIVSGGVLVSDEYQGGAGYRFHISSNSTIIEIANDVTSSENILAQPAKIFIVYKA